MNTKRLKIKLLFALLLAIMVGTAVAGYNPVVHQAQSQLAAAGFHTDVLDGIYGPKTRASIRAYQNSKNLNATGKLDHLTLASLAIGTSVDLVNHIKDWRPVPSQIEIDQMVDVLNDPDQAYSDHRPHAPAGGLDLPGQSILDAMNRAADEYGSRMAGQPKHTAQGYKYMSGCLKTGYSPTHWSDITIHYYCQMSQPRRCYTGAVSGTTTGGVRHSRSDAYKGCAAGKFPNSAQFKPVVDDQPLVFQYVMFGQIHAFNHEQEQAIINAFYGVKNPADKKECNNKRPRRTEDPKDGTHCLVDKVMTKKLIGRSK